MDLSVRAMSGEAAGSMEVSESVFDSRYNPAMVHQVVTAYIAGARSGTKAQKNRSAVRGGKAKPWRQKGGGRARAGTRNSPIWTGGGVTFAAQPRSYSQKVNRKMYRGAVRSILSELVRQDRLVVVDSFSVEHPRTKELLGKLGALGLQDVLLVTESPDENLYLAARNLYHVDVCAVTEVGPASLIGFDKVLVTKGAVQNLEERLA